MNTRFCKRSFLSVYKMCYNFLKVVRFSHLTRDKANIFIIEWDILLVYNYMAKTFKHY
jgi:hypothetical protein